MSLYTKSNEQPSLTACLIYNFPHSLQKEFTIKKVESNLVSPVAKVSRLISIKQRTLMRHILGDLYYYL